ncbi:MAG: threonine/serine exporter family protein [Paludibacter sp.]|nr:threonine/serine exporter family protein [Paludibacter sp.]
MSSNIFQLVLIDGLLAAIAAIGFAVISNPPRKAVYVSAFLAAIGHSLRFFLMKSGMEISLATFVAATTIGLMSLFFAKLIHCPAETFSFPSLLPMIPGLFAYRTVLGLIKFMQNTDAVRSQENLLNIFHNGFTTLFILLALVIGVSLPVLLFPKYSFKVTRKY